MNVGDKLYRVDPSDETPLVEEYEVTKTSKCYAWLTRRKRGTLVCKHSGITIKVRHHALGLPYESTSFAAIERFAAARRRDIIAIEGRLKSAHEHLAWCRSQLSDAAWAAGIIKPLPPLAE